MSLTELLLRHPRRAEVRARLDTFLPAFRGSTPAPLLVPRSSPHSSLVGTALDYAVRLELEHRSQHVRAERWIAEQALALLPRGHRAKAERTIRAARRACARLPQTQAARFHVIAQHAASLAPLDLVLRAGISPFERGAAPIDYASISTEVAAMLAVAGPLWSACVARPLLLNPTVSGHLVGGADADIIAGTTILELKTNKDPIVERDHLRQLVGYACLAAVAAPGQFPDIDTLAVYLPRFGLLRTFPLEVKRDDLADTGRFLAGVWRSRRAA